MTLQQLKYIIEVANKGSINEASKSLFISQPSLSNAVRDLEADLGFRLFLRTSRGTTLSPAGEEFLIHARQVVAQAQRLEERYLGGRPLAQGFSVSTLPWQLAETTFGRFAVTLPGGSCSLRLASVRETIGSLCSLHSELGLIAISSHNSRQVTELLEKYDLVFTPLAPLSFYAILSTGHPLAHQQQLTAAMLAGYRAILPDRDDLYPCQCGSPPTTDKTTENGFFTNSFTSLSSFVAHSHGYTITAGPPPATEDAVVAIPLAEAAGTTAGYILKANTTPSEPCLGFLTALEEACAQQPKEPHSYP